MMAHGRALTVAASTRKRSWVSGSPYAWVVRCRQQLIERQYAGPNQVRRLAAFAWIHRMPCRPPSIRPVSVLRKTARCALLLIAVTLFAVPLEAAAQRAPSLRITAALTLSGPAANIGAEVLEGLQMGIEDASRKALPIDLAIIDDRGTVEGARDAARRIADGDALAVIGPSLSAVAPAVEPIYAEAGLAVLAPNIATDATSSVFRLNLGQSRVGEALADYLHHALGGRRAVVIHSDDGYGQPLALGFRRGAERLGIAATYHPVSNIGQAVIAAQRAAGSSERTAIVLGMLETAAVPVVRMLKRADMPGPFLATASFAYSSYARLFAPEPEEQASPGFFTDGIYAASPVLLDSGGAALLAFGERFYRRQGRGPSWRTILAYDAARMLLASLASMEVRQQDKVARRRTMREAILARDRPARAYPG